jgi:hypothetical protein
MCQYFWHRTVLLDVLTLRLLYYFHLTVYLLPQVLCESSLPLVLIGGITFWKSRATADLIIYLIETGLLLFIRIIALRPRLRWKWPNEFIPLR